MTVSTVLSDIDGTLVDSNYLHVEAWSQAFAALHVPADSWKIHRAIGMDSEKLLDCFLTRDSDARSAVKARHDEIHAGLTSRLRPFEKARDLVEALSQRDITVVLATSAPESELAHLRRALGIDDLVTVVTSADDVKHAKPEPDVIEVALARADSNPQDAVMVGDSVWDIKAALNAHVQCIGVLSRGTSESELQDAGALIVYPDVAAMLDDLDHWLTLPADTIKLRT